MTIDQLAVTVRVEGEGDADEAAFARLFNKYIALWQREMVRTAKQEERASRDRSLGDREPAAAGGSF
ncbi:MAG: hypothetical protein U1E38_06205 [Rhodospirillales bacterium]